MTDEGHEQGRKLRVGVFVVIALVAFLGMIYALGARARLFESRYTIHADFTTVGGLAEGATVRLAGVQIGRVSAVRLPTQPGGKVRVDMSIASQFADRVRRDSVAQIETQGLLGDKIVEISVGSVKVPPTVAGDVIGAKEPADIGQAIEQGTQSIQDFTALARSLRETAETLNQSRLIQDLSTTMASARKVTEQLGRVVNEVEHGRGWARALIYEEPVALRRLNDLIIGTQRLMDRVERGEGAIGVLTSAESAAATRRLLTAIDRLARTTEQTGTDSGLLPRLLFDPRYRSVLEDLRVVAHNFREVSERLAGGRGTLGELLKDEPAAGGIRQTSQDLQAAMANLRAITEKLNEGEGTLGALLADPTVYERLVSILDGAQRSFLLRSLLRNLGAGSDQERKKEGE